eukprot:GHVS01062670.1.p1 GENE.GHVS01062670.1~~GHVS01062670.1.p1  ORF type:complete len:246 (-),score=27.06 GHVS01062670.1:163-900(-)
MKTFRMIVLAVIAAIAIGALSVEAFRENVWCKNDEECPYGTKCLTNIKMVMEPTKIYLDKRKRNPKSFEGIDEINLPHGEGICSEIVMLGLQKEQIDDLKDYSKAVAGSNMMEKHKMDFDISASVVFCKCNEDCGDDICQHKFEHEGVVIQMQEESGICHNVADFVYGEVSDDANGGEVIIDFEVYCDYDGLMTALRVAKDGFKDIEKQFLVFEEDVNVAKIDVQIDETKDIGSGTKDATIEFGY